MQSTMTKPVNAFIAAFERLERERRGGATWLTPIRKAAIARFSELGIPTTADEEWRFTNLDPLARTEFAPAHDSTAKVRPADFKAQVFSDDVACRLVFVNGSFTPELSTMGELPQRVRVMSLGEALRDAPDVLEAHLTRYADTEDRALAALNTAFIRDGAFVHIGRGAVLEKPVQLVFVATALNGRPMVCHPRTLIIAEEGSQACIVESYGGSGEGVTFTNAVTEIVAGDNAVVDHYKVQREQPSAFHVALQRVHTRRSSSVRSHSLAIGGGLVRNDVHAVMDGEGGDCTLNGLYLASGQQHIDNHLRVEHAKPHCNSWEYYKGILDERSSGVFTGRIYVYPGAQKTDAKQTNMNLLLSREARIDTKPQLEIFADDVKCTHGATIGQIDGDAIFYLRSRGIAEGAARSLLVYAFAAESLEAIRVEPLRHQMRELLLSRLPQGDLFRELVDHGHQ
jgi:Fe-S cluster assembly protein SufD